MAQHFGTTRFFNPNNVALKQTVITWSLAAEPGSLDVDDKVAVEVDSDINGDYLITELEAQVLSLWPDGSVKVIRLTTVTDLSPEESIIVTLTKDEKGKDLGSVQPQSVEQKVARRHQTRLRLNSQIKAVFQLTNRASQCAKISAMQAHSSQGPLTKLTEGFWQSPAALPKAVTLSYSLTQHLHDQSCFLDVCLTNPNAAIHPGGKWDLGDPHAFYFNELSVILSTLGKCEYLQINDEQGFRIEAEDKVHLIQVGSGGPNWDSPVHLDRNRNLNVAGPGFRLTQNGHITQGTRARPFAVLNCDGQYFKVELEHFWQLFPSSVEINNGELTLGLFPHMGKENYELQPGEQKTHRLSIRHHTSLEDAINATTYPQPQYQRQNISTAGLLPLLRHNDSEDRVQTLIQTGLTHANNFFTKREQLDEYGWRNFGDLYADHEADGYEGEGPFVSHYNNQYDPIYGFLRQFLISGDQPWYELGDDLARHVIDVDIYHTQHDKAEYNGGLFWHTDHYSQAGTATHRSYSVYQDSGVYEGHQGGGGPGAQHCYTTGLLLHYWLTGSRQSLDALLSLTQWIENTYEGTGTFAELLIGLKNRHRPDVKDPVTGRYPLDRGTGNYIIALLDAYQATSQQQYLDKAGLVIKGTIHPTDDLSQRHLDNVEETWFYTVLLQAVVRFLQTKQGVEQIDQTFEYGRAALLHYCRYIAEHESPYLDKPDILEFPNATWVGQDLRKAGLMKAAAYYAPPEERPGFEERARFFLSYVTDTLQQEPTLHYTRIQALLMQNSGYLSCWDAFPPAPESQGDLSQQAPPLSLKKQLLVRFISLNITQELIWLSKRSSLLNKIITKLGIAS